MAIPQVVIVGRPNVGKSSLFNWLARKRIAIVDQTSGVTRDRVSTMITHNDVYFDVVDTGGMGMEDTDNLTVEVEGQIISAIDAADVVLFVVDAQTGIAPLDEEVAKRLRNVQKPILCVANKCDNVRIENSAGEFYKFGLGPLILVSVAHNRNRQDLLNAIIAKLPFRSLDEQPQPAEMKIAVVGKRNVGKSTFINTLAKADRMIVSEVPGTTRDSVDVIFQVGKRKFIAIDTAGVRKKKSLGGIEFFGVARTERSIRRADVVLFFLDPQSKISEPDLKLGQYIASQHKPCIFVVNKLDLIPPHAPLRKFGKYIRAQFRTMTYVPIVFVSAQTGKHVKGLIKVAEQLFRQANTRVSTSELNQVIEEALATHPPPRRLGKQPKIYYGSQIATCPPTIVMFANRPPLFSRDYQRYLLNTFRKKLPFEEVPIQIYLRRKTRKSPTADSEEKPPQSGLGISLD